MKHQGAHIISRRSLIKGMGAGVGTMALAHGAMAQAQTGPASPPSTITNPPRDKVVNRRSSGYSGDRFHGGEYSIQGTRVPEEQVLRERPPLPRKVLGELVVLKVEKGASVAMITRTNAEVQIGDMVERSN